MFLIGIVEVTNCVCKEITGTVTRDLSGSMGIRTVYSSTRNLFGKGRAR